MSDYQKNLWAPWRMEYIDGIGSGAECFLCRALATSPEQDEQFHVLWRGPQTIALLNRCPYRSGHVLIAPRLHVGEPEQLPDAVMLELLQRTCAAKRVLQAALHAQGFNIGINLGHCAGVGLPEHVHVHVVPRWAGDTHVMAVLGDVKVIPQSLAAVRRLFLEHAATLGLPRA